MLGKHCERATCLLRARTALSTLTCIISCNHCRPIQVWLSSPFYRQEKRLERVGKVPVVPRWHPGWPACGDPALHPCTTRPGWRPPWSPNKPPLHSRCPNAAHAVCFPSCAWDTGFNFECQLEGSSVLLAPCTSQHALELHVCLCACVCLPLHPYTVSPSQEGSVFHSSPYPHRTAPDIWQVLESHVTEKEGGRPGSQVAQHLAHAEGFPPPPWSSPI